MHTLERKARPVKLSRRRLITVLVQSNPDCARGVCSYRKRGMENSTLQRKMRLSGLIHLCHNSLHSYIMLLRLAYGK